MCQALAFSYLCPAAPFWVQGGDRRSWVLPASPCSPGNQPGSSQGLWVSEALWEQEGGTHLDSVSRGPCRPCPQHPHTGLQKTTLGCDLREPGWDSRPPACVLCNGITSCRNARLLGQAGRGRPVGTSPVLRRVYRSTQSALALSTPSPWALVVGCLILSGPAGSNQNQDRRTGGLAFPPAPAGPQRVPGTM